ncbi:MAG: hypothetical protein Q7S93_14220 [Phenylobacterium sp.]|uniref:hypothetical protein n=1 Tax=Phenylobacterium sp. TaxID=1871053 RepID=UPI002720B4DD|nr:hypothetical protein [Phenylobacterium sp.]MDO8411205.1 hypothetical protein [Phenylobacterium sp.]
MVEVDDARRARAEVFREYFALQLSFAEEVSRLSGRPLGEAVRDFTNLHRRLGLGDASTSSPHPEWRDYSGPMEALPDAQARLDWTMRVLAAAPDEPPQPNRVRFGCFSYDPPEAGVVRIHFNNHDSIDGVGPLARSKVPARRSELARMFAHLRRTAPEAEVVVGSSWLYNLEAYRRLFPTDYTASATEAGEVRLSGTSSWGQFLTHSGAVHPERRAAFMTALKRLDPQAPWRAFPLRPLRVTAPVERFYTHFSLG